MIKSLPNLYSYLRLTNVDLNLLINNIDNYYYYKEKPKKKFGKNQIGEDGLIRIRKLLPPIHSLKVLQTRINELLKLATLPHYMYGSVAKKNNIMNARVHAGNKHFLTIDLKEFFRFINNKQVFQVFLNNGFSPAVSRILTQLTTIDGNLPQGAPTSPAIANLAFLDTGNKLLHYLKDYNITFSTFLDDLTFSSKGCFQHQVPTILNIIREAGFYINYDKIKFRVNSCEITGLVVCNGKLKVIPEMKAEAKTNERLKAYCKFVYKSNLKPQA